MAFAVNTQLGPGSLNTTLKLYGQGMTLNNADVEMNMYTKLTGDTTGTINSTLVDVKGVVVIDAVTGIVSGASGAVAKSGGLAVISLTALGAGLAGVILIYGTKQR